MLGVLKKWKTNRRCADASIPTSYIDNDIIDYVYELIKNIDETVDPCENFAKYACGHMKNLDSAGGFPAEKIFEKLFIDVEPKTEFGKIAREQYLVMSTYFNDSTWADSMDFYKELDYLYKLGDFPPKGNVLNSKTVAELEASLGIWISNFFGVLFQDNVFEVRNGFRQMVDYNITEIFRNLNSNSSDSSDLQIERKKVQNFIKKLRDVQSEKSKAEDIELNSLNELNDLLPSVNFDWKTFGEISEQIWDLKKYDGKYKVIVGDFDIIKKTLLLLDSTDLQTLVNFEVYRHIYTLKTDLNKNMFLTCNILLILKTIWDENLSNNTIERPILDAVIKTSDDDKDEQQDVAPPRFIKISDGKISLGPPNISDNNKEKEILERRVLELESALQRVQDQLNHSQCGSPTLEKDLKEQLESMNRTIKSKERKAIQACRDHKALQARFSRQEAILQTLQHENKQLQQRVRQYEHCLDDVMRKVVDALVNEDSLREEVSMLKNRVKDLEAQNAALSASPAKGKDEGYCTMSSGQPQPSNSHLEDLPEEPEQWLLAAEPCSAEMEDWSMSQDELGVITLDDDGNEQEHDWIWNSSYLNSTMIDSQSEGISQLLRETIVYSDDEELTCTDFTRDFYKLVNIPSGSTRSLYSHMDAETDDEDDDDDDDDEDEVEIEEIHSNDDKLIEHGQNINNNLSNNGSNNNTNSDKKLFSKMTKNKKSGPSPTPSEAGRALVTSCSSSESEGLPIQTTTNSYNIISNDICEIYPPSSYDNFDENHIPIVNNKVLRSEVQSSLIPLSSIKLKEISTPSTSFSKNTSNLNSVWRKSNGWKRIATTSPKKEEQIIAKQSISPLKKSKIPPPVPVRRSYAS